MLTGKTPPELGNDDGYDDNDGDDSDDDDSDDNLIGVLKSRPFCWPNGQEEEVKPKDGNEDQHLENFQYFHVFNVLIIGCLHSPKDLYLD